MLVVLLVALVTVGHTRKSDNLEFVSDLEEDIVEDFASNGTDVNEYDPSDLDDLLPSLVGDGEELAEDEKSLGDVASDWWEKDAEAIPDYWDVRKLGVVPPAIYQGANCGSCGFVAGVQSLEARIALVSENHVPYSVQNIMNCDGRVCIGTQPYRVATLVRSAMHIVPLHEMNYTKAACKKWGEGKSMCHCGAKLGNYTNVLDDQFVFVGPTVAAKSAEKLKRALQSGPVTTCYTRAGAKKLGVKCKNGCSHSNSIVGYNKTHFRIQESYGAKWGQFHDGSWSTDIYDRCGSALIQKAYFTSIIYDYDRANAYFTEMEVQAKTVDILDLATLKRIDFYNPQFTEEDTRNVGLAKNRCAFLGAYCKGVMKSSNGEFKLISGVQRQRRGDKGLPMVKVFKKTQMVVFFQNVESGKVLVIRTWRKGDTLRLVLKLKPFNRKKAAKFFTSYGRLVSYMYPNYHLVENRLEKIESDIKVSRNVSTDQTWTLNDCNLSNKISQKSLDLDEIPMVTKKYTYLENGITGAPTNLTSDTQRFDVGISGTWSLVSSKLGRPLLSDKKSGMMTFSQPGNKKKVVFYRWNARQIMSRIGKPFDQHFNLMEGYFEFSDDPDNAVLPTDCQLVKSSDQSRLMVVNGKRVKMAHGVAGKAREDRWNLFYEKE